MKWMDRLAGVVTEHSRRVLAVMLVLTAFMGAGATMVERSTTVEAFSVDPPEIEANRYVRANFSAREGNTTTVQVVTRNPGGNVLSKASLLRTLRLQRRLRANETVAGTLVENRSVVGVANVLASAAVLCERRPDLCARGRRLQERKRTLKRRAAALRADYRALRNGTAPPNVTVESLRERAETLRAARDDLTADFEAFRADLQSVARSLPDPTLREQIRALEGLNATELDRIERQALSGNATLPGAASALKLMPRGYEPGSTTARARMLVVTQRTEAPVLLGSSVTRAVIDAQQAIRHLARASPGPEEYVVFGAGFTTVEEKQSITDSLVLVGPLALLFVLAALSLAYRDALDVVLGFLGILLVLTWTLGAMGWLGIVFNQVMMAVPILLVGLAIDYAIHVFMRYREARAGGDGVRPAMRTAVAGVGTALVLVTLTTAIGFLANLTSPVPDIAEMGVVAALGIVSALVVFTLAIPALKTELDALLEARGYDRAKRAIGTDESRFGAVISLGATAARKAPVAVLVAALLLSAGGAYAGLHVETAYSQQSFYADDPPAWMKDLPEPFAPGDYFLKENLNYIYDNFQSPDTQAAILVEGDVTDPETLEAMAVARRVARDKESTFVGPSGDPVLTPLTAMRSTARYDAAFNATFHAADTDGDGIPDRDLAGVYDAFYAADPTLARRVIHRSDGEYRALHVQIAVEGTLPNGEIAADVRAVAERIEQESGALRATAAGTPVVISVILGLLSATVVESLGVTLVAVLLLLALSYRVTEGSASLGAITLVPVVFALTWILGTMYLLGIPFGFTTAMIGAIAVGLGIDYAIHVSERYGQELARHDDHEQALDKTVAGTGGALLSSAVTTASGFGVLVFSLLPALQRFGLIIAIAIVYAFLASVFVFPSLLVLWTRHVSSHPADAAAESESPAVE